MEESNDVGTNHDAKQDLEDHDRHAHTNGNLRQQRSSDGDQKDDQDRVAGHR